MEDSGFIDLYFGDESHFGLTQWTLCLANQRESDIATAAKGRFLNVVGLMNRKNKLFFDVLESTFNTDKLICFIDRLIAQTIKKIIVILDNSPIHRSKKFKAKIRCGESKMYIFSSYLRIHLN